LSAAGRTRNLHFLPVQHLNDARDRFPAVSTSHHQNRIGYGDRMPLKMPMIVIGVRRDKAAIPSGCKSRPAADSAASIRTSHGGNEIAEAFSVERRFMADRVES